MSILKILAASFFLISIHQNGDAQIRKNIDSLQAIEQNCLDSGISGKHMENCSCEFRNQMDSILNVVYNNIRKNLNAKQKEILKQEELNWLRKREINHEASRKESKREGIDGHDAGMIACDDDAKYVIRRIYALIDKWN